MNHPALSSANTLLEGPLLQFGVGFLPLTHRLVALSCQDIADLSLLEEYDKNVTKGLAGILGRRNPLCMDQKLSADSMRDCGFYLTSNKQHL